MTQIGLQELRQNLSRYLQRVSTGESLQITDRKKPVAILMPVPKAPEVLDRLAAEGRATAPRLDLADIGPPLSLPTELSISEALREQRED